MDEVMNTPSMKAVMALGLVCVLPLSAYAQAKVPLAPPTAPTGAPNSLMEMDRDGDGKKDFRVSYDAKGRVAEEDMDYNYDGIYDTFYYYTAGILQRVEIDSASTGRIDIWVYLLQGTYISKYERDTDGDGKPDLVRDYSGG
jgi:hypothetical protein